MNKHDLFDIFQSLVLGFVDTIPVFKSLLPDRVASKSGFGLSELAKDYLTANDIPEGCYAVNVKILQSLIIKLNCDDGTMKQHAKTLTIFIQSLPENVEDCKTSLESLVKGTVPNTTLTILAKAGISLEKLKDMYGANGDAGVTELLSAAIGEKSQTPRNQKIINTIITKLSARPSTDNINALAN